MLFTTKEARNDVIGACA